MRRVSFLRITAIPRTAAAVLAPQTFNKQGSDFGDKIKIDCNTRLSRESYTKLSVMSYARRW